MTDGVRYTASMLEFRWRCRDGAFLTAQPNGVALTRAGLPDILLPLPPVLVEDALRLNHGTSEDALAATAEGDIGMTARTFRLKHQLQKAGLLVADLYGGSPPRRLAVMRPHSATFDPALPPARRTRQSNRWVLSRFAYLHREDSRLVLKCPEAPCDVELDDPDMVRWMYDASVSVSPEPESARAQVLSLLADLGFVDDPDEEEPAARQIWEFQDRLFHFQSQIHEDFKPYGGTYRFREGSGDEYVDRLPSPPAIHTPYDGDTIELPVPETATSRPLLDVMESRRSQREMGEVPVRLDQVAALLYRVARVTRRMPHGPQAPQELLGRPYPSGGAIHELEFYLAVRVCQGLAAGFYHYRNDAHALTRLPGGNAEQAASAMTSQCAQSWGMNDKPPQCVVAVTSRLPRLAWKYTAIAYRISLLNAGCVVQSLYLVATDIGLNGSAAGASRPGLFAQATGVSSWEETSIVEFGFGSRPLDAG